MSIRLAPTLVGLCLGFIMHHTYSSGFAQAGSARHFLEANTPVVVAHRGLSAEAPENTLEAFERAMDQGVQIIELDYHLSQDGIPIVIHDSTLNRTTDATQRGYRKDMPVNEVTATALGKLDAGSWFRPSFGGTRLPTLAESLRLILGKERIPLVESKAGSPAVLLRLLEEQKAIDKVIVQSFDWHFVSACRAAAKELVLGALGPPSHWHGKKLTAREKQLDRRFIDEVVAVGADVVGWNDQVDAQSVSLAHDQGLKVWVYTIDDPQIAARLVGMGVDGIISNKPPLIQSEVSH